MKGKPEVLAELSERLKEELAAINQYILHAEMCDNWGYLRLSKQTKMQAIGEMKHAEVLIERILFLEGLPNLNEFPKLKIGKNVQQQPQNDLNLDKEAVEEYNMYIVLGRKEGDNASADLFEVLLKDEEQHVDFLEAQLGLIEQMGLQNYLAQQMYG